MVSALENYAHVWEEGLQSAFVSALAKCKGCFKGGNLQNSVDVCYHYNY